MSLTVQWPLRQPGFSLVELLFAMAVMAVALLGVASMFPAALRSVVTGGQASKATMLAREMVEMIQADSFADLVSRYNGFKTDTLSISCPIAPPATPDSEYNKKKWTCDIQAAGGQDSRQGLPAGSGTISVDCMNADGTTAPCSTEIPLLRVTVTIAWGSQGDRSVTLVTYVAKTL